MTASTTATPMVITVTVVTTVTVDSPSDQWPAARTVAGHSYFDIINSMLNFKYDKEIEDKAFEAQKRNSKASEEFFNLCKDSAEKVKIDTENPFIKKQIQVIRENWENIQDNFLEKLGNFYEKKLEYPNITCGLVRAFSFPYNYITEDKWFAAPLFGSPGEINRVIMHELCHYYQPQELPRPIKEAIPIILNDRTSFGPITKDRGRSEEEEQKWRKIIWDLYKEENTFSDLLKLVE